MLVKYRKDEQYKNIKRKKKSDFSTTVKGVTRAFSLPAKGAGLQLRRLREAPRALGPAGITSELKLAIKG